MYVVALTGKANHLAQRNSLHNKRMKWGPLVRLLQNLPELHPTLSSSQLFSLDADAHRPQLSLLQLSLIDMTAETSFSSVSHSIQSKTEGITTARLNMIVSTQLLSLHTSSCQKHDVARLLLTCMEAKGWPTLLPWLQNASPHVKNVPCQCRCSTVKPFLFYKVIISGYNIKKKSWNYLLCHHTLSCIMGASQATKLLRK